MGNLLLIGGLGTSEILMMIFLFAPFILFCWLIIALIRYLNSKSKK